MNTVYSVSLSAQLTLDMHSLNNEGGEGNQIQTRMVNIVNDKGQLRNVNAISGDMIKHILAEHLHRIAVANQLPLCAGCKTFNANRISADPVFSQFAEAKDKSNTDVLTKLIQTCAVDDMMGNLLTAGSRSLPRKSVVEFGWVVGLPEQTRSDSYFHVKYAPEKPKKDSGQSEEELKANLGQAIFHRPANSGVYALVATIEAARIGFNDISQQYVISLEERQARYQALLESLLYTLVEPAGAMRGTQAPHIVNVEGVVTVSQKVIPAPTISPLKENYNQELHNLCDTLNTLRPDSLAAHSFSNLSEYAQTVTQLIQTTLPYTFQYV